MRPIVTEQNPLRFPLNAILGTQAGVRLLRVMAVEVDGPVSASDAAIRAGLTLPGAQKALARLFRSGFVSRVGGGRKHQYEICRSNRLMLITSELFQAEKDRYEQLVTEIKKEIQSLTPHPYAAWIQTVPKEIGDPLTLGLLHETGHLTDFVRRLRIKLNQVEKAFDLTVEVKGYTKADISDAILGGVTLLFGILPLWTDLSKPRINALASHRERDRLLLELSGKLAEAIEKDASLVKRAKEHIDRLLKINQGPASRDLREWRDILEMYSIQRLSRFITSTSERANRLRQSNPFFVVLAPEDQTRLLHGLENKNDTGSA
ncbi:MAG: hypothetical protein C4530_19980 [Desulfobacteraceae bacterium]|nr:MAG: hypothetical protein C4530_19980 [Desulfobacteraceae bacterium]